MERPSKSPAMVLKLSAKLFSISLLAVLSLPKTDNQKTPESHGASRKSVERHDKMSSVELAWLVSRRGDGI